MRIVEQIGELVEDMTTNWPLWQDPVVTVGYVPSFMQTGGAFMFQGVTSGGGGSSQSQPAWDTSPGDGVYGLRVEFVDGKIRVTAETDGWFDDHQRDQTYDSTWEVDVEAGWTNEFPNTDQWWDFVGTFEPFAPIDIPIG